MPIDLIKNEEITDKFNFIFIQNKEIIKSRFVFIITAQVKFTTNLRFT